MKFCRGRSYKGTPDYPDKDRFWRIVEKYGVTLKDKYEEKEG